MKSFPLYRSFGFFLLAVLLVPVLAHATGIKSGGIVTGTVVDAEGNPMPGILLQLAPKSDDALPTYKIKTNKKGVYLFRAEAGVYRLTVQDSEYGLDRATREMRDEQRKHVPDEDWEGRIPPGQDPPDIEVRTRHTIQFDIELGTLEALKGEYSQHLLGTIARQLEAGETEEAERTVKVLLDNSPGDPLGLTLRAYIHAEQGRFDQAEKDLQSVLASDPGAGDARYLLATLYLKTDRTEEAVGLLKSVAEGSGLAELRGKAWISLADIQRDAGNPREAVAALEKAAEASPELKPVVVPEIAAIYSTLGEADKAEEWLGMLGTEKESDPTVLYNIAVGHFNANQYDQAIAGFRKVVEAKPDFAEAYRDLGWALVNQGQMDEAKQSFGKYLELSPDASDAEEIKGIVEALGG